MQTYIIERNIPGVGEFSDEQLCSATEQSNMVLDELAPDVQWVESFVTEDKTFCVYRAKREDAIYQHAERSGFPANVVSRVVGRMDPTTTA